MRGGLVHMGASASYAENAVGEESSHFKGGSRVAGGSIHSRFVSMVLSGATAASSARYQMTGLDPRTGQWHSWESIGAPTAVHPKGRTLTSISHVKKSDV